jgi:hypothetical protein
LLDFRLEEFVGRQIQHATEPGSDLQTKQLGGSQLLTPMQGIVVCSY